MTTPTSYDAVRVSDGALIRLAEALVGIDESAVCTYTAQGGIRITISKTTRPTKGQKATYSNDSFLLTSGTIAIPKADFGLEYRRAMVFGIQSGGYTNWVKAGSGFTDGFTLAGPNANYSDAVFRAINENISLAAPGNAPGEGGVGTTELIINRLTDASAAVFERSAEQLRDLAAYRATIDREAAELIQRERQRLANDHATAIAAVEKREQRLVEDTKGFDDRSNTHVRRELQQKMAGLSENALKEPLLNRSNSAFLLPIGLSALAVAALALLIVREVDGLDALAFAVTKTVNDETIKAASKPALISSLSQSLVFSQMRVVLQTVGAGLLVWFALRIANNRYRQISRWEHDLHKFRLDTERASFLIEGELEARKTNNSLLPEVVLDRFSRGLFTSDGDDRRGDGDEVGATLGHLLSRAASVKIGTDGVSVEVDKSGIKKARKESKSGGDVG